MNKRLYYCVLWRSFREAPMTKFVYADSLSELLDTFMDFGYASISITDITDKEIDGFEL